jgi:DNA-binding MarR family transcriptional regulator
MMAKKSSRDAQKVAEQMHSAAIHLLRKLRREDAESGLNAPRLSALSVIVFAGPLTLGDLAAAEQVRPPTMTRIVDALVEQGLATRNKNSQDRRRTLIATTAAGKRLLLEGRERRVRALARQISALDGRSQKTLQEAAKILKRVIDAI